MRDVYPNHEANEQADARVIAVGYWAICIVVGATFGYLLGVL